MIEKELRKGCVVISKCGHDEGSILLVVGYDNERVLVVDGDKRKLKSPKKKNPSHLTYRGERVEGFEALIEEGALTDSMVRKKLTEFAKKKSDNRIEI